MAKFIIRVQNRDLPYVRAEDFYIASNGALVFEDAEGNSIQAFNENEWDTVRRYEETK